MTEGKDPEEKARKRIAEKSEGANGTRNKKKTKGQSINPGTESPSSTNIKKTFGFGGPEILCDVCFTPEADVGKDGHLPENQHPLIQCRTCKLVAHSVCFIPINIVGKDGYFECDACSRLQEESKKPLPSKSIKELQRNKYFSPEPLPSTIDAEDDGRLYPPPKFPGGLDIFCTLCNRRDVRGGIKPTYGIQWCHLACSMSSPSMYTLGNRLTGIGNALSMSRKNIRETMGFKQAICECCSRLGGMLIQCAHNYGSKQEKPCTVFMHSLCAELGERERVIVTNKNDDMILYKCALHSFGEDAKCNICGLCSGQNNILECDGCSRGFHMSCLPTPLIDVPDGDWFCPICKPEEHDLPEEKKKEPLSTGIKAKDSTSTDKKNDGNSQSTKETIITILSKSSSENSLPQKKTTTSDPTKKKSDISNNVRENYGSMTKNSNLPIEQVKTTTVAPASEILSHSATKETDITNYDPASRSNIPRYKTADSFPIGDPSIDYSLATNIPEPTKL